MRRPVIHELASGWPSRRPNRVRWVLRAAERRRKHGATVVSAALSLLLCVLVFQANAYAADPEVAEPASVGEAAESDDAEAALRDGSGEAEGVEQVRPRIPSSEERPRIAPLFTAPPALGVVVVEISGEINPGMAAFVGRAVEAAGTADAPLADALIVRVDTFGGRVDSAVIIRDTLLSSPVPVVAYVQNRAISAGALITYAADHIVFSPAASMGAATPIQTSGGEATPVDEKFTSYMRAEMRSTAEAHGRRTDLAEAMVDRTLSIDGVVDRDTLLTLTTSEAIALEVADGVADDLNALLAQLGVGDATIHSVEQTWAEKLAIWITAPAVASILMSLGLLGLWVEIKAPGFGFPGALGVLFLGAFFFGHMIVHLAGWEEVMLALIGIILLAIEVLVVPGFGVPGVLGILSLAAAFLLAMVGLPMGESLDTGLLNDAAFAVVMSILLSFVALFALSRVLPERAMPDWLVLRTAIVDRSGAADQDGPGRILRSELVGRVGVATTDLRPSGRVRVESELLDVVSQSDWIAKGTTVRVSEVEGVRIVVVAVEPAGTPSVDLSTT